LSHRADPEFLADLRDYGALNIESCFNCGNCTAVCPLSSGDDNFPRRMIRYGQLGMRKELLGSKELWMCYSCGECTATCPRQADPGEFMAAARRYAIAGYEPLGLARLLYTSSLFNVLFLVLMTALLGFLLNSIHGPMAKDTLRLFGFIPSNAIHDTGIAAGLFVILLLATGAVNMIVRIRKMATVPEGSRFNRLAAILETIGEVFMHRRYRLDCETRGETPRWYLRKWFVHASLMWGFTGLLLATALDYLLALTGIKATGTWVPIWYPVRLLGTLAGILLVYGVTVAIIKRLLKTDESSAKSTPSDWSFLFLLWLAAITGFALEVAIYLPQPHSWSYWMLSAHLVFAAELLVLMPFTKFSHVVYRSAALYIHALKPTRESETLGAGATD
jgi:quinone-modifying oxidoreductase, subunit QmoC